ncbi:hypothetical protein [Paenarthrobacter ureafaciens]|uniref:hypothetical protein n=1 Tax=Paenarthrobacter ureafaciens TaxID=37931 RepID=UPI00140E81B3|nr:hypothetical protein [Paenarthrobacter ureafaciens]MCX8456655.1 hypothetical protein [Paenarthrobacter ureafaciens]MCY0974982.1 hypothetical protein [Paenarthrobacter ureafaciens]MCY0975494.1 hypothetical protein [Paenarthrobacter ureafaciens]
MTVKKIKGGKAPLSVALTTALLGGIGIGIAQALPAEVQATTSEKEITPVLVHDGDAGFDRNESGLSYGVPTEINGRLAEPDLIRAYATNGKLGFIKNTERKVATGDPSLFKSPQEALRWQESRGDGPVTVPVYDLDGITQIGIFEFSTGQPTGTLK